MFTTVEAVYEDGVLKPLNSKGLKEHKKYKVILEDTEDNKEEAMLTKPHPLLGKIVFHENPELPLNSEDWPDEDTDAHNS